MDRSAVALGIDVAVCIYDRRAQTFENSPHRYEDAAAAHDGRLVEGHDLPVDDDGDVGGENRADRRGGRDRSGRGEAGRTPESLHSYLPPRNDSEGNAYPSAGRVFARLLDAGVRSPRFIARARPVPAASLPRRSRAGRL